ncbi:MAG: DUF6950 family protein [Longimicrobiales bacterium]
MTLVPNWDTLLFGWATDLVGSPFEWGRTDCGSLVREACRIMSGSDSFESIRYDSMESALHAYAHHGGVGGLLLRAGWAEIPLAFVQQGDVLIQDRADEHGLPSAGVVVARLLLVADPVTGVHFMPVPGEGTLLRHGHG